MKNHVVFGASLGAGICAVVLMIYLYAYVRSLSVFTGNLTNFMGYILMPIIAGMVAFHKAHNALSKKNEE